MSVLFRRMTGSVLTRALLTFAESTLSAANGLSARLALVPLVGACAGDVPAAGDSTVTAATDTAAVRVEHARERDLTGDGAAERIAVTAEGPRADSLEVRLEIRGPDGALLHLARWNARDYFKYDDFGALSTDEKERRVRDELALLVADTAFAPREGTDARGRPIRVDSAAIAYDVAAHVWRRANGIADTLPLPMAWLRAQEDSNVAGAPSVVARADSLAAELAGQPTYTYFAGGEETYTIAWSPRERRFVKVWACC